MCGSESQAGHSETKALRARKEHDYGSQGLKTLGNRIYKRRPIP